MKKLIIISFLLLVSCQVSNHTFIEEKTHKGDYYFPIKTELERGDINAKLDTHQNTWYSKHLFSMGEPMLKDLNKNNIEIYRYTNLGTWSNPYVYRIEKCDSIVRITKKRTNGYGGYESGSLVDNETKVINYEKWKSLINKIDSISFWELETHGERGLDGAEWVLEGYKEGKYHFITRWSPDSYGDKKFVETCQYFEKIFKNKLE